MLGLLFKTKEYDWMNERTLEVLEFDKVISLLEEKTATTVGRELANRVKAETDIENITALQAETDEAVHIIRLNKSIPLAHVANITEYVNRSKIGGVLDTEACLQIAQM